MPPISERSDRNELGRCVSIASIFCWWHWPHGLPLAGRPWGARRHEARGSRAIRVANFNIAILERAIRLCPEHVVALQAGISPYLVSRRSWRPAVGTGLIFIAIVRCAGSDHRRSAMTRSPRTKGKTDRPDRATLARQQDGLSRPSRDLRTPARCRSIWMCSVCARE